MADNNRPTHRILAILPRGEDAKPFWQQIGAAWTNSDGSINLKLELQPTDPSVTLQLRPVDENKEGE